MTRPGSNRRGHSRRGNDHPQSLASHADLDRSLADVLAIGVHIHRSIRLQSQTFRLEIFHLSDAEMASEVNGWEQREQLRLADIAHDADVEFAIVEPGVRGNLHAATEGRSVGKSGEQSTARLAGFAVWKGKHSLRRSELCQRRQQGERVSSVASQPARQPIRPPRDFSVKPHPTHTAEEVPMPMWSGRLARERLNYTKINRPNIGPTFHKLGPGRERITPFRDAQGTGKIVPAATRDDQNRQMQLDQLLEVPVHRAVAAEDQDCVGVA